jgi:3-mercaptopyruvate sulfurtransferase SseA
MRQTSRLLLACLAMLLPSLASAQERPGFQADEAVSVPRIALAELKKLVDAGRVTLVDVRDLQSYRSGHIPGAIAIPLGTESQHIARLREAKKPIVTYCA